MTVVDLFAGPGGWDEGIKPLGIRPFGYEWDTAACETGRAAGHIRIQEDIAQLSPTKLHPNGIEGLIASPPCQGFTLAGKGLGRRDTELLLEVIQGATPGNIDAIIDALHNKMNDDRSVLALEPLRWALQLVPTWMAWEQVAPVLPLWEACAAVLRNHGWSVETGRIQAEQYGVPQTRRRAILVARRDGKDARFPTPTHSKYHSRNPEKLDPGVEKWVSMAEALQASAEDIANWQQRSNYSAGGRGRTAQERGRTTRSLEEPSVTLTSKGFQWQPVAAVEGDTSWAYRRPSPTIVGSFAPDVVAAPGWRKAGDGPRQKQPGSIKVSVEEAAVLQSFPADYPFQGSRTAKYRQVGDAVPPLLAWHIVKEITS